LLSGRWGNKHQAEIINLELRKSGKEAIGSLHPISTDLSVFETQGGKEVIAT
jgi:hypothetical protein